jgi:hypothetical protein
MKKYRQVILGKFSSLTSPEMQHWIISWKKIHQCIPFTTLELWESDCYKCLWSIFSEFLYQCERAIVK